MVGLGREDKKDNDLFYTCSLIDYISRKTKNIRADVVNQLGRKRLEKIYDLADVYHCDNIDQILLQRRTYQQGGSIMSRNANIQFPLIGILEKYINA